MRPTHNSERIRASPKSQSLAIGLVLRSTNMFQFQGWLSAILASCTTVYSEYE